MPTSHRIATLLCAGTLLACSAEPTPNHVLAPQLRLSKTPVNAAGPSASGHANVTLVPSGLLRTFSFHARVRSDGTVEGEYENHNRQLGSSNHGDIDCLRFLAPNRAIMSGTIRRTDNPGATVGGRSVFTVEDNGEGAGDPPDRVSQLLLLPPGSNQDCTNSTNTTSIPIEGGNVRVDP